jgi:hypothetical protein
MTVCLFVAFLSLCRLKFFYFIFPIRHRDNRELLYIIIIPERLGDVFSRCFIKRKIVAFYFWATREIEIKSESKRADIYVYIFKYSERGKDKKFEIRGWT